jgi:hypothetical protein
VSGKSFSAVTNGAISKKESIDMSEEIRKREDTELVEQDQSELSEEELARLQAEGLPDRENMSLVDANVAVPVNAAVAANVLTDHSNATSGATQSGTVTQTNHPHR